MIIVRPDQIEEFANRLSTDRALRVAEKTKIKTYVLAIVRVQGRQNNATINTTN